MEAMMLALANCIIVGGVVVAILPRLLAERLLLPTLLAVFLLWSFEFMLMLVSDQPPLAAAVRASLIVVASLAAATWIARGRGEGRDGRDERSSRSMRHPPDDAVSLRPQKR